MCVCVTVITVKKRDKEKECDGDRQMDRYLFFPLFFVGSRKYQVVTNYYSKNISKKHRIIMYNRVKNLGFFFFFFCLDDHDHRRQR